jgi:hypothetical protein
MSLRRILPAVLALGVAATVAAAAPAPTKPAGGACFWSRDITNWRDVGERQVNLEVLHRDVYRLDLAFDCPSLHFAHQSLILDAAGGGPVCASSLPDVIVPGQAVRCPVTRITKLTPEEVKALPKKERP